MSRSIAPSLAAIAALSLAAPTLGGCAGNDGAYPSLARRPVERITGSSPVVAPAPVPAPAPSARSLGLLDQLVAQARSADAKFHANTPHAQALVGAAADAAIASESWAVATVALADLESQRSNVMIALADLDAAYAAATVAREDASAIAAARQQVIDIVAGEDTVLAGLKGRLRS